MTNDRERTGDWNRTEWVGEGQDDSGEHTTREGVADETPQPGDRWTKTQWVGDQGDGGTAPQDPDLMPEGERGLSGDRHNPGEQHWSRGQGGETPEPAGDRPLDRR